MKHDFINGEMDMVSVLLRMLFVVFIIVLLNACATQKSIVVLLPDQEGKTGAIEIRNEGGSQKLDAPHQATEVESSKEAPAPPRIMPSEEVTRLFGETMSAMPPAPAHYTLYFYNDSTQFTEASAHTFEDVLASIKKINPAEISVVGHTDRVGSREQNYKLGIERATQVKEMLIRGGVDAKIVEITSHGEDNSLIKTRDEIMEPRNRRVEIVIR